MGPRRCARGCHRSHEIAPSSCLGFSLATGATHSSLSLQLYLSPQLSLSFSFALAFLLPTSSLSTFFALFFIDARAAGRPRRSVTSRADPTAGNPHSSSYSYSYSCLGPRSAGRTQLRGHGATPRRWLRARVDKTCGRMSLRGRVQQQDRHP